MRFLVNSLYKKQANCNIPAGSSSATPHFLLRATFSIICVTVAQFLGLPYFICPQQFRVVPLRENYRLFKKSHIGTKIKSNRFKARKFTCNLPPTIAALLFRAHLVRPAANSLPILNRSLSVLVFAVLGVITMLYYFANFFISFCYASRQLLLQRAKIFF